MKLKEWIKNNWKPGDLCAPEMEAGVAASILATELLGEDWCVPYSCNGKQALAEAVMALVNKFKGEKQ